MQREGTLLLTGAMAVPSDQEPDWKKHKRGEYTYVEFACILSHLDAIRKAYTNGDQVCLLFLSFFCFFGGLTL